MKMKFILFGISCVLLQTFSYAAVINRSKTATKTTGIDPASFVTIGDDKYYISPSAVHVTALEATRLCNDNGMKLLSFERREKMDLIYTFLKDNDYSFANYWLSGRKWEQVWQWTGSGKIISFFDWNGGEPNETGSSICTSFGVYSGWMDTNCSYEFSFICEY